MLLKLIQLSRISRIKLNFTIILLNKKEKSLKKNQPNSGKKNMLPENADKVTIKRRKEENKKNHPRNKRRSTPKKERRLRLQKVTSQN